MNVASIEVGRNIVRELFAAALAAVDPAEAVRRALRFDGLNLMVGGVAVDARGGVHLVAVGKAAVAMTKGALTVLDGLVLGGTVITKDGHVSHPLPTRLHVYEAGHPIPDDRGVDATRQTLQALREVSPDAVVVALISGGGSALLEAPKEGLTLADFQRVTDLLLRAGAPIEDLNAVRAPLSRVKAGGLRRAAPSQTWVTLILSDVLGNDPRIIASGPTVPGRNDPAYALRLLDRYGLRDQAPAAVIDCLLEQTSPSGEEGSSADMLEIVGDNATAVQAAAARASEMGLSPEVVWQAASGEASALGEAFVEHVRDAPPGANVLLGGGEATVTVRGSGRGGRNTEFALAAAMALERQGLSEWVVASLATDGQDALTGLAGAIADAGTAERSRHKGIDPVDALRQNDSMRVFEVAGGAVETGPTGTNVNDLYIGVRIGGTAAVSGEVTGG